MVFSSILFIFYFLPFVLAVYYTIGRCSLKLRNLLLLLASLVFYAWGEPGYVFLLLFCCVFNWGIALLLERYDRKRKLWLLIACVGDLGVLFVFKYWDFVMGSLNAAAGRELFPVLGLTLPIGISFYTFQALSYVIDVYRKTAAPQKSLMNVALYISLFPQLVAGPIVRYSSVEKQIQNRRHTWQLFSEGCARFVQGLAKKVILANSFAVIADTVFRLTRAGHTALSVPVTLAWLGSFAYTLQIFFDFSAYSDMAIGLGRMFGFRFEENFNYPYISKSVGEFWRRWHISLGTWFKEYVYFPLGGSRVENQDKMVRNLFVVWTLTGLWHGAAWNFVLWGMLNFVCLLLERLFQFEKPGKHEWLKHLSTMFLINMGWVLFRCEDFYQLGEYLGNMFLRYDNGFFSPYTWMFLKEYALIWIVGVCLCTPVAARTGEKLAKRYPWLERTVYPIGMAALFGISVVYLSKSGYNPFIYFNF